MTDVNGNDSSSESNEVEDKSLEASEADTEKSEVDESGKPSKANQRIQQLVKERNDAVQLSQTLRQYAVDPKEYQSFSAWRQAQVKAAEEAEAEGDISPAKLAALRKVMYQADPNLAKLIARDRERDEREAQEAENRMAVQWDDAEETVRDFAVKTIGIPAKNEKATAAFAGQVMLAIQNDPKLLRQWQTGNLKCVPRACQLVKEEFVDTIRKSVPMSAQIASDRRRISRLPGLPSGGSSVGSGNSAAQKEKGITKQTHDDAWALIQQSMQE